MYSVNAKKGLPVSMKKASALILSVIVLISFCSCMNGNANIGSHVPEVLKSSDKPQSAITEADAVAQGAIAEKQVISFAAAGDNLIHPCIYMDAEDRALAGGRKYNFKPMYDDVADIIKNADISFINQETVMAGADFGYSGYPMFNSPQDLGLDLCELGFDIVNIANNHMLDKRAAGLESTINFWNSTSACMIGGYLNEDDYNNIRVIEKDNFKIALLSYAQDTNGIRLDYNSELFIPYISDDEIIRQVAEAKKISDFVIVSVHWGTENVMAPNSEQKRLAKLMAENEVDVILGHHSHTVLPIEMLDRPSGRQTLCIYSLGNFVSAMEYPKNMLGGILTFDIVNESGKAPYVDNVLFNPTVFYYGPSYYNSHIYRLEDFTDALANRHGTLTLYGHSISLASMTNMIKGQIDAEYLPDYLK